MNTKKMNLPLATEALEKILGPYSFAMFFISSRNRLHLTQTQLAKKLNISRSAVCEIEKGRTLVSPETAARYAKKIGYPEELAIEASLNDSLRKAKIKKRVKLIDAA